MKNAGQANACMSERDKLGVVYTDKDAQKKRKKEA